MQIVGFIHHAHASGADAFAQPVVSQYRSGRRQIGRFGGEETRRVLDSGPSRKGAAGRLAVGFEEPHNPRAQFVIAGAACVQSGLALVFRQVAELVKELARPPVDFRRHRPISQAWRTCVSSTADSRPVSIWRVLYPFPLRLMEPYA